MNTEEFLSCMNTGKVVKGGSELHKYMTELSYEAMQITTELNGKYHNPEEIRGLLSEITGKPVDENLVLFPPFYTDCGKNIIIGKNVFIGSCCYFQDQGGVKIGDGVLVGHNTTFATLNHCFDPVSRSSTIPKPIVIGDRVWIGGKRNHSAGSNHRRQCDNCRRSSCNKGRACRQRCRRSSGKGYKINI